MARKSTSSHPQRQPALPTVHVHAAGIDVGSRFHVAAVPPDLCSEPVRTYQSGSSVEFVGELWLG